MQATKVDSTDALRDALKEAKELHSVLRFRVLRVRALGFWGFRGLGA